MAQNDLTGLGEINALLGRGTEYEGKLTFTGRVRLDGAFKGEIFSDDVLIVGDGAEVRASIDVGTLIVRGGELWGDIRARQLVEIHAPGRVHGNIRTPQLFIDKGVVFDGKCTMDDAVETEVHELDGGSARPTALEAHDEPEAGQPEPEVAQPEPEVAQPEAARPELANGPTEVDP